MKEKINSYIKEIEQALKFYNPVLNNPQQNIYKSVNYSIEAGGKRLRPILMLESYKICGGKSDDIKAFACALEMIHTYSLIHDDLPAMDNDSLRRGKPTNHIVFGEATAILAGDCLLTRAFELMSGEYSFDKSDQINAINYIARCSGSEGMIGGQVVDIENEDKKADIQTLKYLHSLKTGALIKAACVVGAILAGADKNTIDIIFDYAENLGIAFQIRDDILDVIGDEKNLGKNIGSDAESNKNTYVTLFGTEKSQHLCRQYTNNALNCLDRLSGDVNFLREFTVSLTDRIN